MWQKMLFNEIFLVLALFSKVSVGLAHSRLGSWFSNIIDVKNIASIADSGLGPALFIFHLGVNISWPLCGHLLSDTDTIL